MCWKNLHLVLWIDTATTSFTIMSYLATIVHPRELRMCFDGVNQSNDGSAVATKDMSDTKVNKHLANQFTEVFEEKRCGENTRTLRRVVREKRARLFPTNVRMSSTVDESF